MGYIENAIERTNLQTLRAFMLNGAEGLNHNNDTYENRLERATASMHVRLSNLYSDKEEQQDALNDFYHALSEYENVYTEVGMQLGTKLIFELLTIEKLPAKI